MAESLSAEQTADYRKRLRARHAELVEDVRQALLRSDSERYIEMAGAVHDAGDESVADLLADLAAEDIDRHVRQIREVEDALQRVASGTYGVCADCGQAVERARLDAYPAAARCHACQRMHERTHEGTGGATL